MALATGPTKRTKHIDVKHYYIQQQFSNQNLELVQIPSADQKADLFTKPLPASSYLQYLTPQSARMCDRDCGGAVNISQTIIPITPALFVNISQHRC
jgi:hypothetical protein